MSLWRYALQRVLYAIPTIVFLVALTFAVVHLSPGDPAYALAGENATDAYLEEVRRRYGLDRPLTEQFLLYVNHLVHGDLGASYTFQRPVTDIIAARIGPSLLLVLAGLTLGIIAGTFLGAVAVRYRGRVEKLLNALGTTFYSIPIFALGLLLIYVFAVMLGLTPAGGMYSLPRKDGLAGFLDVLGHLALPTLTLALYTFPPYYRLTRARMIGVMDAEFIRTARAFGLPDRRVFYRHGLRNAMLPSVTLAGLTIGQSAGGAILAEAVFSWPGLGTLMTQAISQRDLPLIMGVFIVVSGAVIVATIITDILYVVIDPRVRLS